MFTPRLWTRSSRRLLLLLLAVVVPPAATLVWLGLELIERDRQERQEAAAATAINSLDVSLAEAERLLTGGPLPDGLARVIWSSGGTEADPGDRVLWSAAPAPGVAADDVIFAAAETHEFGDRPGEALRHYTALGRSPNAAVRAGAGLRIARIHAAARRWNAALAVYHPLVDAVDLAIDGAPVDLQARRAIGDILQAAGRARELATHAAALEFDLLGGRWTTRIDRALWEVAVADVERWTGRAIAVAPDRALFSAATDSLWEELRQTTRSPGETGGWRLIATDVMPVTTLVDGQRRRALMVSPAHVALWMDRAARTAGPSARLAIASARPIADPGARPAADTIRIAADNSGLPWTLAMTLGESPATAAVVAARRQLLAIGMGAILLLLGGTSYVLWRLMSRELAVARLQTEFVSAVSHEFRTPLTSIKHVTELLDESDELAPDERKAFYGALARNTDRLQRFVESLLDFARLEAGRRPYELEPIDAGEFAAAVVADFQREVESRGITVALQRDPAALAVVADGTSLANALWNLLDNAVKYSPGVDTVFVSVGQATGGVALAVRDMGIGIPAGEQRDIFKRFVRGRAASRLRIGGTGLGLAIVSHVVHAHGGTVGVESAEGAGSTFTIVLPAAPDVVERPVDHPAGLVGVRG